MPHDIPYEIPYLLDDRRIDAYHWMRDYRGEFISNAFKTTEYTRFFLSPLNSLIRSLILEMESKIDLDASFFEKQVGGYFYYSIYEKDENYPTLYRRAVAEKTPEKIIKWDNKTVLNYTPSPDGRFITFVLDEHGTQFGSIALYDMEERVLSYPEYGETNNGNIVWNDQSDAFWYVKANDLKRTDKVFYYEIKDKHSSLVYFEPDNRFEVEIIKDKNFVYIISSAIDATEIAKINKQNNHFDLIIARDKKLLAKVIPGNDETFLLIHEKNDNGSLHKLSQNHDYERIYQAKKEYLENVIPLKEYFVLAVRENGLPALKLLSKIHFAENKIEIPIGKIDVRYSDYENSTFTIEFSSPIHAPNRYHYCCKHQTFDKPFKASSDEFEMVREFVSSNGQDVPVTLVYKKGVEKNSKNPLLLYAYGAYGSAIDLSFYKPYSSLLNRGVILAYAHVRGGGEFGEPWHEAAKKEKKIATFKDLIAVSEYLIDEGYSSNERMALQGGSAGGTLAAGIINMRPDLFRVVLLEVPFVDAITDLNDPSIPYTPQEWEEWGNPQNINELKAIREWSPIDNIKWGAKPAVYITAGMNDVQVPCYEPYKYFAKLKRHQAGKNPILFELIKGGHKGDTGRYSSIRQIAPMYAFLLNQLGIKR